MAANESAAVAGVKSYAGAQDIFYRTDWNGDGVNEYAKTLVGKYSLFETKEGLGDIALIDSAFARAEYSQAEPKPKAGYIFKVLTGQGADAQGGNISYVDSNGRMTKGYAIIATPASWDTTGRNSFIINHEGKVLQCDLGNQTKAIVDEMTVYNPTTIWVVAE